MVFKNRDLRHKTASRIKIAHIQIEIAQSYQEHHALLPHAMWTYICQNWDLNSSKWGPKFVKMGTHFE